MKEETKSVGASVLTIPKIASWQLPSALLQSDLGRTGIQAVPPALQRGLVWKPQQTERLWDSLLRGFPVGAFLFSPYNSETKEKYGKQDSTLAQTNRKNAKQEEITHYLLDGQQRAYAIALGFYDIWESRCFDSRKNGPVLWLDLGAAPDKDDREFVLRLITRSHPWGYKRTNSEERLEASHIRDAFENYRRLAPTFQNDNPARFPLQHVWPWDAVAPIPLAFLMKAVRSDEADKAAAVLKELYRLPFWNDGESGSAMLINDVGFRDTLLAALDGRNELLKRRFDQAVKSVIALVAEDNGIPALVLPESSSEKSTVGMGQSVKFGEPANERQDPVETIFVRVNAGGTRLEGEELIYSLLKSAWKDAPQALEKLQPGGHHLLTPARMVTLITRVLLARQQQADAAGKFPAPPPPLEVARFRRWIREKESLEKLKAFIDGPASQILAAAHCILTLDSEKWPLASYRLPPSLVAKLTQGETGADLMLLLLVWMDRMIAAKRDPLKLPSNSQKRLLGFFTALSWFSRDSSACLRRLWQQLKSCKPKILPSFFNVTRFKSLLPADRRVGFIVLPIVPPDILESVVRNRVTHPRMKRYSGFKQNKPRFWKSSSNWHFNEWLVTDEFVDLDQKLKNWLLELPLNEAAFRAVLPDVADEQVSKKDRKSMLHDMWGQFLVRIWSGYQLVEYAQRDWLTSWFPEFDPTLPDQMEDINRPWDYDHIHAYSFVKSKKDLPSVVKDWHSCIGNLRAWPMELNRADHDKAPRVKLTWPKEPEQKQTLLVRPDTSVQIAVSETRYQMFSEEDIRLASFVHKTEWENYWENSVPVSKPGRYLAQPSTPMERKCRMDLIMAITGRFCRIYREWYTTLHLRDLC